MIFQWTEIERRGAVLTRVMLSVACGTAALCNTVHHCATLCSTVQHCATLCSDQQRSVGGGAYVWVLEV